MSTLERVPLATEKRYADICFGLFIAGALAGALQLLRPVPFGDGFEMVAIARNLAAHGHFANPFLVLKTGPTAANPPLYPLFLAALIKALRIPSLILAIAATGNIAMNALTASLLPRVSRLFYGSFIPGVIAAIFWIASVRIMPAWDVSYTVAVLLVFCLCTANPSTTAGQRMPAALFAGSLAGLLFLLNPSSLLITIPWAAYLVFRRKLLLKEATFLFAILLLIIFIWMARNRRELGAFVVRTNLGLSLYASNNECAEASLVANESHNCYQSHAPNTSMPEAQLVRSLGEVKYDHLRIADTKQWIKTHPGRFSVLTAERFRNFWFPPLRKQPYTSCFIWVSTAFSIWGLILMIFRRKPEALFILAVLALYPLMYYVVASDVRYRYPVLWLSLLPAGYCIQQLAPHRLKQFATRCAKTLSV